MPCKEKKVGCRKTGEFIYHQIKENIFSGPEKAKVESNFMGISTGKAPNMLAVEAGLVNRLQQDYPHILIIHDYSHIFNLTAKDAAAKLSEIKSIVKTISNYFANDNITRNAQFCSLQRKIMGKKEKEVLQVITYTDKRFLSLYESAERIIELWECLKLYKEGRPGRQVEGGPNLQPVAGHPDLLVNFTDKNKLSISIFLALLEKLSGANEWFQDTNRPFPEVYQKLITVFSTLARIVTSGIEQKKRRSYQRV